MSKNLDILIEDYIDNLFLESARYSPPYTADEVKRKYGINLYNKLNQDPAHKWRMETGIELIHREPSYKEQMRIFRNWQLMSKEQKRISDKKSFELFGMSNMDHHAKLIKEWGKQKSFIS